MNRVLKQQEPSSETSDEPSSETASEPSEEPSSEAASEPSSEVSKNHIFHPQPVTVWTSQCRCTKKHMEWIGLRTMDFILATRMVSDPTTFGLGLGEL